MAVHKGKNKISNRSTGGNIKAGLVPSTGKSKMMRDKSGKSVVDLKKDNELFLPQPPKSNFKFNFHTNVKPSTQYIEMEKLLTLSKNIFAKHSPNKYFAAFVIKSSNNNISVFLYNKPNSPYNFFSCTFSKDINTNEFVKLQLHPGKVTKIIFSNPSFNNLSTFYSISIDHYIKTRIPYSQINSLPLSEQSKIEETTKLLTGYSPIEVWYKDKVDKNNVLCNFLPTEGAGIYEFILNVSERFTLPNENILILHTHKIIH